MLKIEMNKHALAALALAFAMVGGASANAASVFTYTGANFTNANDPFTTSENVTGSVTFTAPLTANLNHADVLADISAFSFTAGPETLSNLTFNASPSFSHFDLSTDAAGNITGWDIQIGLGGGGNFILKNFSSIIGPQIGDQVTVGANYTPPAGDTKFNAGSAFAKNLTAGAFTAAGVPEPATWALMLGGFGLLGGAMRARRKTAGSFA